jgi:hypothetical protein
MNRLVVAIIAVTSSECGKTAATQERTQMSASQDTAVGDGDALRGRRMEGSRGIPGHLAGRPVYRARSGRGRTRPQEEDCDGRNAICLLALISSSSHSAH